MVYMKTIFNSGFEQNPILQDLHNRYLEGERVTDLANELKVSALTIYRHFDKQNLPITGYRYPSNKIPFNEHIFDEIDTKEKAYWLGFLAADGCNHNNQRISLRLGIADFNHLVKFADFLGYPSSHIQIINANPSNLCNIATRSKHFCNALKKHGVVHRKTTIVKMPNLSNNLIKYWIAGYMDGDGCISVDKRGSISIGIASASIVVIEDIIKHLSNKFSFAKKNITSSLGKKKANSQMYSVKWNGPKAIKIINYLYDDLNDLALERKYSNTNKYLRRHPDMDIDKAIKRIEKYKPRNFSWDITREELSRLL